MPGLVRRSMRCLAAAIPVAALLTVGPASVLAHGVPPAPVDGWTALTAWSLEVHVVLPLLLAALAYHWAVGVVDRAHPASPVPRRRVWAWYSGLAVLFVALESPIGTYDTTLFSAHMLQHLLLMMVAAPLLVLAAPITLLLRVVRPETRQRVIIPILHSRLLRAVSFPVVAWLVFAGTLYVSHFSPLFDAALESEPIHLLEHALYLAAALLFWWPVIGADPSPWRMPHAARVFYLLIGMPWSSFLGLAILSAPAALYAHYATVDRSWGPTPLEDQQMAGALMWAGGDALFLIAMILAIAAWLRSEEAEGRRLDAQLDRQLAREASAAAASVGPEGG